jgi:hypothetical protein
MIMRNVKFSALIILICLFFVVSVNADRAQSTPIKKFVRAGVNLKWKGTGINLNPKIPSHNQTVTFTAYLTSTLFPSKDIKVIAGIDGSVKYTNTISKLETNQSAAFSFTWKGKIGDHMVFFSADPDNTIKESSETDNKVEKEFKVVTGRVSIKLGKTRKIAPLKKTMTFKYPETGKMDVEAVSLKFTDTLNPNMKKFTIKWRNNGETLIHLLEWHIIEIKTGREIVVYKARVNNSSGFAKPGEVISHKGKVYKMHVQPDSCYKKVGIQGGRFFVCTRYRFVVDFNNLINEENESNNSKEAAVYWHPR